ncbi:MAG: molybdopterin cofactor-binding domain-containing protein [Acidimicrobiales bacterium]
MDPDGSATVFTGSSAHGQGHATAWSMIVHDLTGIPMDRVEVVHGDTAKVEAGVGTYGSRSLQVGGSALHRATSHLVARRRGGGEAARRGRGRGGARHRDGDVLGRVGVGRGGWVG